MFHVESRIFRYYLRKIKNKFKKTRFLTESKEQHQTLKRTEIIMYMKGVASFSRPRSLH